MVYIDWQLSLVANFFVLFAILQMHRYFLNSFNIGHLISDIAISLIFGYIGLFVDDIFILLFVGFILLANWLLNKRHLNMEQSISLIMAANVETILFSLGTYTARIIFFIALNEWKLQILEEFQQNFILVSLLINTLYLVLFLLFANFYRAATVKLWIQIEQYHLGKRVFTMSFGVFIAFMVILLISDMQSVTATLQASILLIFTIILIFTYRQLIFFVRTIAIQRQAQAKVIYNKQLNDYLTSVQQQYTDLRKFKHDFQNIMLSMKSFVDTSDSTELKQYYQDIVQEQTEMSTVGNGNIAQIQAVDSDAIRGLIIQKFFIAKSQQIDFQIELTQEKYHFDENILIIVRILGILLDNAFEYVQTIDEKRVTCAITQDDNITEITVDNPINESLNFKDLFKTGYTTKDKHTGFGLANARRLITETDNLYLETKIIHGHLLMTLIIVGGE
ncbi:sensor histidine kinase [Companilactobacillus nantensis]|nr:GHKL domain-containing protein [Companilactobacillus nantensis]